MLARNCRAMDVDGPVTSPTTCWRGCIPRQAGAPALVHVDVYRLLDHAAADLLAELDSLDLDTDLDDDAVVVVEWGEGLAERLSSVISTSGSTGPPIRRCGPRRGAGAEDDPGAGDRHRDAHGDRGGGTAPMA